MPRLVAALASDPSSADPAVSYRPLGDNEMLRRTWTRIMDSRPVRTTRWEYLALLGIEVALALVPLPMAFHIAAVTTLHAALIVKHSRS